MIGVKKNVIVFFGLFLVGMLLVPPSIPFMIPEAEAASLIETYDGTTVTFNFMFGDSRTSSGHDGTGQGQIASSTNGGFAVDDSGNIYYSDTPTNRVQKFDSSGNFLLEIGPSTSSDAHDCPSHFLSTAGSNSQPSARADVLSKSYICGPGGIAVDSSGNLYVVAGWQPSVGLYKFSSSDKMKSIKKVVKTIELKPLSPKLLRLCLNRILQLEGVKIDSDSIAKLVTKSRGDIRSMINFTQARVTGFDPPTEKSFESLDIEEGINAFYKANSTVEARSILYSLRIVQVFLIK